MVHYGVWGLPAIPTLVWVMIGYSCLAVKITALQRQQLLLTDLIWCLSLLMKAILNQLVNISLWTLLFVAPGSVLCSQNSSQPTLTACVLISALSHPWLFTVKTFVSHIWVVYPSLQNYNFMVIHSIFFKRDKDEIKYFKAYFLFNILMQRGLKRLSLHPHN